MSAADFDWFAGFELRNAQERTFVNLANIDVRQLCALVALQRLDLPSRVRRAEVGIGKLLNEREKTPPAATDPLSSEEIAAIGAERAKAFSDAVAAQQEVERRRHNADLENRLAEALKELSICAAATFSIVFNDDWFELDLVRLATSVRRGGAYEQGLRGIGRAEIRDRIEFAAESFKVLKDIAPAIDDFYFRTITRLNVHISDAKSSEISAKLVQRAREALSRGLNCPLPFSVDEMLMLPAPNTAEGSTEDVPPLVTGTAGTGNAAPVGAEGNPPHIGKPWERPDLRPLIHGPDSLGPHALGQSQLGADATYSAELSEGAKLLATTEGRAEAAEGLAELGVASEGLAKRLEEIEHKAPTAFDVAAAAAMHFGEVGTGAFDVYADAMEESLSIQSLLSQRTGRAMQNALAATLRSVGREAAASAVMEAAKGTAAATGLFDEKKFGSATGHFAAAAMFGSVAGLAGIGSASVSVQPGGSPGSRESRAGGRVGTGGGAGIQVTVIGSLDDEARRQLAQRLAEEIAAH